MSRVILCLQFHESDKATAMRLARFITDIEPVKRDDVEICFVARYDCEHDEETERYCAEKFNVSRFKTTTKWNGWPAGPNACVVDTLQWMARRVNSGQSPDINALILIEPDCVPVHTNWINILMAEWKKAQERDTWMMGAWRASGGDVGHINGNCVLRPNFSSFVDLKCITQDLAWDCGIALQVHKHWWPTYQIKNRFDSRNATEKDIFTPDHGTAPPCLVHGYKDDSAYNIARRLLLECAL
jgi:hypothetical protein